MLKTSMKHWLKNTSALSTSFSLYGLGVFSSLLLNGQALANPEHAKVVRGKAGIEQSSKKLDIYQQTQKAVINWKSFDIAKGEHTQFHQPNAQSVTLNRIQDNKASSILGRLSANGNIILINPNGILFGRGSRIDVNGLIASSADIDNNAFMAGDLTFDKPGHLDASIQNYGKITAKEAGLVGLVAPGVINDGIITARLGRVHLASGDQFSVDLYGDGLLSVKVSDGVRRQLVANTGLIEADGGIIALTASAGREIVDSLIFHEGILQARTVREVEGKIILSASGSNSVVGNVSAGKGLKEGLSTVFVRGILDASGRGSGERGGEISILGDQLAVLDGSILDASGFSSRSGGVSRSMESGSATLTSSRHVRSEDAFLSHEGRAGGSIKIGGDYLGQGSTPSARSVFISEGVKIFNNALDRGDGGRTIIWSDDRTYFGGYVQSRGGEASGHGGFLETSGKSGLLAQGYADLSSPHGLKGTYLLDPSDITIYGNVDPAFVSSDNSVNLSTDLILWLDGSDFSKVKITYSNAGSAGFTATGAQGSNTLTFNTAPSSNWEVGQRIRLGGAGTDQTADILGADTYTITAISGMTVTVEESLTQVYTSSGIYRGVVSQWKDKSSSANDANITTGNNTNFFNWADKRITLNAGSTVGTLELNASLLPIGSSSRHFFTTSENDNPTVAGWQWVFSYGTFLTREGFSFGKNSSSSKITIASIGDDLITSDDWVANTLTLNGYGYDGTKLFSRENGGTQSTHTVSLNTGTTHAWLGFQINNMESWTGSVAEHFGYKRELTDTERYLMEQYQSSNWDIALTPPGTGATEAAKAMASDGFSIFTTRYLERLSQGADIVLQADNSITLDLKGDTLNLSDDRSLSLTTTNGDISTASNGIVQTNRTGSGGNITFTSGGDINFAHDFTLNAQNGGEVVLNASAGSIEVMSSKTLALNDSPLTVETDTFTVTGDITGNGNSSFIYRQGTATKTLGVGAGGSPDISLSDALITEIKSGFGRYSFGRSDGGDIYNYTSSWDGNIHFLSMGKFTNEVNVTTSQNFLANVGGDLVLNLPVLANGTGLDALVLSGGGNMLINGVGAFALSAPNGRWIVYSNGPVGNQRQSLLPDGVHFGMSYATDAPATISVGDRFVYATSTHPVLTYQAGPDSVEYGDAYTGSSMTSYVSGLVGDDSLLDIGLAGSANLSSSSYVAGDVPGIYTGSLTATQGSLVTVLGYDFVFTPGDLTVTKAPLTVIANAASREYGDSNPVLTGSITGFKLGEDASVLDAAPVYATTATQNTDVGTYAITASGGSDNNYSFTSYMNADLAITQAPLTVAANAVSREYGGSNPVLTGSITGFKLGEDVSVLDAAPVYATTATQNTDVGTYAITASGGSDNNYSFTSYMNADLSITQAPLTVAANAVSREYGDSNPVLTGSITGFKLGEDASVLDAAPVYATTATQNDNVGTYAITASGGSDNNYSFTSYMNADLAITQAPLTVTANAVSREYGDSNPVLTGSITGFKLGEDASVLDAAPVYATTATQNTDVGTYAITASGGSDNNYSFTSYMNADLAITQAPLTVAANAVSREYGDSNPVLTGSITGFKLGEDASVLDAAPVYATTATQNTDVGTYAITASGGSDNNYSFTSYMNADLAITQAPLTVAANAVSREYGDNNPVLTGSITGFKLGEDASVLDAAPVYATTATQNDNVGTYAITASGGSDNNYSFSIPTNIQANLTITQAPLTVAANAVSREYGDSNPVLTGSITGFKLGEDASVLDAAPVYATTATQNDNVGTYAITASGGSDNNYSFTSYMNADLAITQAPLTVAANAVSREYGDSNPVLTGSITGFKLGEDASVLDAAPVYATTATQNTDVGTYAITASGGSDNNYSFTSYMNADLAITQAPLTVAANAVSREYGDSNPVLTGSITGFKLGEDASVLDAAPVYATTATQNTDVGTYAITASGGSDNNYSFTSYMNADLAITQAPLTVAANAASREYGDSNPVLTGSITGFKLGEDASVLDAAPVYATTATQNTDVGTYAITASGGSDNNYSFTSYMNADLAITQAPLTVAANAVSREYGDSNPVLTGSITGFKLGEDASVLDAAPVYATTATQNDNVGTYAITASGGSDNNYSFTSYMNADLAITQAPLTVAANAVSREYGDSNPVLTGSITGFKLGEDASVLDAAPVYATTATQNTDVGTYAITASGGSDNNYSFTSYMNADLAITQAPLTVAANAVSREYGDNNPVLTGSITGFKLGEDASVLDAAPVYATTATQNTDVGTYAITASGGSDNNYSFTSYMNADLAITQAPLTVTANAVSREYGDNNPVLTGSITGFKLGEDASVLDAAPVYATTATQNTDVGTYAITASGGSDNNYSFTSYMNADLAITQAPLTVTANAVSREYGDSNPVLTGSITGFKLGEDASVLDAAPVYATTATQNTDVGTYAITASGGSDNNYSFTSYMNADLAITQAPLTVAANAVSREYGDNNPVLTGSITGFKLGEDASVLDAAPVYATTATQNTDVGTYAITASGGSDNNYSFTSYMNADLAITQAPLTVAANAVSREYGDSNPVLTGSITGFKLGEDASVLDAAPVYATTATQNTDVGTYAITASGGSDNNYSFTSYMNADLAITQAPLTVAANAASREYGDSNPVLTGSITGFKLGEDASVLDAAPVYATTATQNTDVGTYAITASGGSDNNYSFTSYMNADLAITQAPLTVAANAVSREYGDSNPVLTGSITGFKLGEDASVLDAAPVYATTATQNTDVGTYAITASGGSDNNYSFTSYMNADLAITQAPLTVAANAVSREYGDSNPVLTGSITGFKLGEDASVLDAAPVYATTATQNTDVGTYAITASGGSDNNYSFTSYMNADLAITQAPLTVAANAVSREYGDNNPVLTGSITGFKLGEDASVLDAAPVYATTATQNTDVGTYAITASGGSDNNYSFTSYMNADLAITQAPLTVTANAVSREYGDNNPVLTGSITGFKLGEDASVLDAAPVYATTATQNTDVGTYAITASGGSDNNYSFTSYMNADLAITQAPLTVTANAVSREYGDSNPVLTGSITGFKLGEDASVLDAAPVYATTATQNTDVGTYAITASGGSDNNYSFTSYMNADLAITQAPLTVAANAVSREYGDNNPVLTGSITGFKLGEDASVLDAAPVYATTATQNTDVGTYAITASGGSDNNYSFTSYMNADLAITQAPLTVAANAVSREYGDSNPVLTGSITGFKLGEDASVLDAAPVYATTATQNTDVGTYAITASGGSDNNYSFTSYMNADLAITQAPLTVAANAVSREYGDSNPVLTGSITGFKLGEDASVLDAAPVYATIATLDSPSGKYAIEASGGSAQNYDFKYISGEFIIEAPILNTVLEVSQGGSYQVSTHEAGITLSEIALEQDIDLGTESFISEEGARNLSLEEDKKELSIKRGNGLLTIDPELAGLLGLRTIW